jgi:hypothetical protein
MKLHLLQQITELNHSFDELIVGLAKLESIPFFQRELIRHARSYVEIARVDANREFFDNFEKIVEDDAKWAYRFQRAFDKKLKDRDDIYLEVRDSERRRNRKGLPPRVVILPDWDWSDEDRYDEKHSQRRKKSVLKTRRPAQNTANESRSGFRDPRGRPGKEGAVHEKGEADQPRLSSIRSWLPVSRTARQSRGVGRAQIPTSFAASQVRCFCENRRPVFD